MYRFPNIAALRAHLEIRQSEMAESIGLSLRTYATVESLALSELDAKTLKLLELASLDFAVEYGDTSLALPRIAALAVKFTRRLPPREASKLSKRQHKG